LLALAFAKFWGKRNPLDAQQIVGRERRERVSQLAWCGEGVDSRRRVNSNVMPELRYHHIGIPTDKALPAEDYIQRYKLYASGYLQSPYGVEWMRFDPDCTLPELIKTVPHVAFVVDDIAAAIAGEEVLIRPNSPAEGITVAFIVDNGAPIEFLQFDRPGVEVPSPPHRLRQFPF